MTDKESDIKKRLERIEKKLNDIDKNIWILFSNEGILEDTFEGRLDIISRYIASLSNRLVVIEKEKGLLKDDILERELKREKEKSIQIKREFEDMHSEIKDVSKNQDKFCKKCGARLPRDSSSDTGYGECPSCGRRSYLIAGR